MKNSVKEFKGTFDQAEKKISKLQDKTIEIIKQRTESKKLEEKQRKEKQTA